MSMTWGGDQVRRLEEAQSRAGKSLRELAAKCGVPYSTLQKIMSGLTEPGIGKLAAIAQALGVSIDWIMQGGGGGPPSIGSSEWLFKAAQPGVRKATSAVEAPVFELEVAAGDGRSVLDEAPVGQWPLPIDWVAEKVGANLNLIIVKVRGDSQEPILTDGDRLIVDRNQRKLATGLSVVRVDDVLKVKRIELQGRMVALTSANPNWPPEMIDREADQDRFEIIGRAIAAIKTL